MSATHRLPDWVVCPSCQGELKQAASLQDAREIACGRCPASFPVEAGIPILLDARERQEAASHAETDSSPGYHQARHGAPSNIQYYDFWCQDMLRRLPGRRYTRVVELMAGGAELSRRARDLPRPIVAIDTNLDLLRWSRDELWPDTVPVCATAERLPFRDGAIDLVMIQGGLHHVRRRVARVLGEIARCMAPAGVLLASEPRNDSLLNRAFRRAFYRLHPIPDAEEEDGFTEDELRSLLRDAGLELRQCDPFAYVGYMLIGNTDLIPLFSRMKANWLSSLLIGIDRRWASVPLGRELGWASQVLAEKPSTAADA